MDIKEELEKEFNESPILTAIFNSALDMIFIFDSNSKLKAVNNEVKKYLKNNSKNDFIDFQIEDYQNLSCSYEEKDLECNFGQFCNSCTMKNIVTEVLKTKSPIYNKEGVLNIEASGISKKVAILMNAIPMKVKGIESVILSVRDIEDIKKYQREQFENMERFALIGSSASLIVHDLKNPLTGLVGYVELLKLKIQDEQYFNIFKKLDKSINKFKNMLQDILNISSGQTELILNTEKILLKNFFEEFLDLISFNSEILLNIEEDLYSEIDKSKMNNVIWNLVKNADEANNNENSKIEIIVKEEFNEILIEIKDNGKGMPQKVKDNIFKLGSTYGKENGTGFGLVSTKQIIEAHGGSIYFESEEGKGTSFFIKLKKI